jgi:hypothetical protein
MVERGTQHDAVDVGRFPGPHAFVVDARLHPADVVAHDEEYIGLGVSLGLRGAGSQHRGGGQQRPERPRQNLALISATLSGSPICFLT